ncbi:MAG: 1-deoxy-D-xylulose-5-phosphate reductoisomerase [Oscillospiraceae bacterium]|nr:1-deoxy-D-xylulose-5-phosphate reductoisomerase [Oscillospiraceae bacterium]
MMNNIILLGSTGSIGTQSLDVCRNHGYRVSVLAARKNIELLEQQAREFMPEAVAVFDEEAGKKLKIALADTHIKVLCGAEGVCEAAVWESGNIVINAVVGMDGLKPTLAAVQAGKTLALANKETLVVAGSIITDAAKKSGIKILPVDSEHSAIFQCIQGLLPGQLERVILTASGGPFFGKSREELEHVTVEQTLKHPNWSMGSKITVDSATLINKGLEIIEAAYLFGVSEENIDVVVHRESIIHSLIELVDGSVLAQLGVPDMRIPIQYALTYPERTQSQVKRLSLADVGKLTFYHPDNDAFPGLRIGRTALRMGGLYPCMMNGANEKAVELFLKGKIGFNQIGELVEKSFNIDVKGHAVTMDSIVEADKFIREYTADAASKL